MVGLSNDIIYIFVGLILSDGNIEYRSTKGKEKKIDRDLVLVNSRFRFKQSMIHVSYLLYVFILLSHYCISPPKIKKETVKGKQYFLIEFLTRSLPVFTLLRHKFYVGRVKIIPSDIYDYISYESLAHIIMCDGSHMQGGGVVLNLHNFTIKELVLLINVLKIKFDLDCNLHKSLLEGDGIITVDLQKSGTPRVRIVISLANKLENFEMLTLIKKVLKVLSNTYGIQSSNFNIGQKNDYKILELIRDYFKSNTLIIKDKKLYKKKLFYYRFYLYNKNSRKLLFNHLNNYPLLGEKRISYLK
ncbi:cytochrome c oxidase subunit 1 [Pichia californica]|nr:cytochrome c oxidase subunit 1 [[Candida] californica]